MSDLKFKFSKPEVEGETAVVEVEGNPYADGLPEGLDVAAVKKLETYHREYIDAFNEQAADTAHSVFKKDKKVKEVTVKAPFGADGRSNVTDVIKREVERVNPSTGDKFTTPAIRTVVNWRGGKGSKAKHQRVLAELREKLAK